MSSKEEEIDGGQIAIKGFVVQALAALLEALESDDWVTFTVEPVSKHEDFQKVDVLFTWKSGRRIAIQVKTSVNNISVPIAEKWAAELKASVKADEYRLELYAPAAGGLTQLPAIGGVQLKIVYGDLDTLWDAATSRLSAVVASARGHYHQHVIKAAGKTFVGQTIVRALENREWTRADLLQSLLQLVEAESARKERTGAFDYSLRRVIVGHENGTCTEYVKYTFSSREAFDLHPSLWGITWTDADHISVLRVSDGEEGHPDHYGVRDDVTGAVEYQIRPRWVLSPGKPRSICVTIHRNPGLMTVADGVWVFQDAVLAADRPYAAEILVRFPMAGLIESADARDRDSHAARWSFLVGREQRKVSAVSRAAAAPPITGNASALVDQAQAEHGK